MPNDEITGRIIQCAIEVHRQLGPGLLESTYVEAFSRELRYGVNFVHEVEVPVLYKGEPLKGMYRLDFVVENHVIVELKATEHLAPVHEAQLLTYMRHTGIPVGLLLNFNSAVMKHGLRRLELHEWRSDPRVRHIVTRINDSVLAGNSKSAGRQ